MERNMEATGQRLGSRSRHLFGYVDTTTSSKVVSGLKGPRSTIPTAATKKPVWAKYIMSLD